MERFKLGFAIAVLMSMPQMMVLAQEVALPLATQAPMEEARGAHRARSTVMGGEIKRVDAVRDELLLKVFGRGQVKVLFDEKTAVFVDGKAVATSSLAAVDRASVETVAVKGTIYAVSIHILSGRQGGECEGSVLSYAAETHTLMLRGIVAGTTLRIGVTDQTEISAGDSGVAVAGADRLSVSGLRKGTQVSVRFAPDAHGLPIATQIMVLATPGTPVAMSGEVSFLDLHLGVLGIHDEVRGKEMDIHFSVARLPLLKEVHVGDSLDISAVFDGNTYEAESIVPNQAR